MYENILPIFGDKGRNDLSIYLLQPRTGVVVWLGLAGINNEKEEPNGNSN